MLARSRVLAALLVGVCVGLAASLARANMARSVIDGERFGPLVAQGSTAVRVDRETLTFVVAEDLASAEVTAVYEMTNTGLDSHDEVAFVYVRGDDEASPAATITVDGAAVPVRVVGDAEQFAAKLGAWLTAHPEVEASLRGLAAREPTSADEAALRRVVEAAGGRCEVDCDELVRWYAARGGEAAGGVREELVVRAARAAIPGEVHALTQGWSTLGPRRMTWLRFQLDFAAQQSRTVTVRYQHRPARDLAAHVPATFVYEYLLSPASSWLGFGPLDVTVQLPERTRLVSSAAFVAEGDRQRVVLPGLPAGELRFEVMSVRGLWFGRTDPGFYWALLGLAAALANLAVGRAVARDRPRRGRGWARTLLHALGSGLLAMLAVTAVVAVLLAVFPARALGFGYGGIVGSVLIVLLSGLIGVVVSVAAAIRLPRPGVSSG